MAEHDRDKDRHIEIIHAVMPRDEMGSLSNSNRSSPFASYYIELEPNHREQRLAVSIARVKADLARRGIRFG